MKNSLNYYYIIEIDSAEPDEEPNKIRTKQIALPLLKSAYSLHDKPCKLYKVSDIDSNDKELIHQYPNNLNEILYYLLEVDGLEITKEEAIFDAIHKGFRRMKYYYREYKKSSKLYKISSDGTDFKKLIKTVPEEKKKATQKELRNIIEILMDEISLYEKQNNVKIIKDDTSNMVYNILNSFTKSKNKE